MGTHHIGRVNLHPTAQRPTHADPRDVCFRAMVSLLPPHPFLMVDDGPHQTTGKECYSWVSMAVPPLDGRFVALPPFVDTSTTLALWYPSRA